MLYTEDCIKKNKLQFIFLEFFLHYTAPLESWDTSLPRDPLRWDLGIWIYYTIAYHFQKIRSSHSFGLGQVWIDSYIFYQCIDDKGIGRFGNWSESLTAVSSNTDSTYYLLMQQWNSYCIWQAWCFTIFPIWQKSDLYLPYRTEDLITPHYWSFQVNFV